MGVSRVSLIAATLLFGVWALPLPAFGGAREGRLPEKEALDGAPPAAPAPPRGAPARPPAAEQEDLGIIPAEKRIVPPPLPRDLEWIRTPPLTLEMFKKRVVLIEVWESACVNCLRSLPSVSRLHAAYSRAPFLAMGIHSPEYSFNLSRAAVERASRRLGLEFPVASDPRLSFWDSWDIGGWPTTILLDAHGRLAFMHQGELAPGAMEQRIRYLIRESWPEARLPDVQFVEPDRDPFAPECGFVTHEVPTSPGLDFLRNPEGYRRGITVLYADPGKARTEGTFYLRGSWSWLRDGLKRAAMPVPSAIGITYRAKEVFAVLALSGGGPIEVEVRQDGSPLQECCRGDDIEVTPDGRSVILVREPRIHYIVRNPDVSRHDLELIPKTAGFQIHSFSFANRCQTDFPHR